MMERIVGNLMDGYHKTFHKCCMFAPITDADRLISFTTESKLYCKKHGDGYLGFRFEPLSATLFMNFKRTGNRVDYENVYFGKRRALNALVMAEYVENNGQYLDDIINGIYSICEESTWVLPPHNSYIRDTPQLILPDSDRPILDLFACETGTLLATIYHLLQPSLDLVSPFIGSRILSELQKRIITPYLTEHFWWMGKGEEPMCNWTIWCTQNILLTASQIPLGNDIYQKIVRKCADSTDYFLKEYGNDGCCDEGAQYYRHSGLCLYLTLALLNIICENAFISLWNNKKIRNMAEYICNVHVEGPYYINFADCSPIAGRAGVREFLFGKAIGSDPLCSFASLDYVADSDPHMSDEINLTYHLLEYLYESEMRTYAKNHPNQIPAQNVWYESVGIFIARSQNSCLAVKAGDNNDSHNHNDTGSIIIYAKGQPILVDIGVESYTLKTFSPDRYEIWTMQSGYHNLPTLNGYDQLPGETFWAKDVDIHLTTDCSLSKPQSISMELIDAYPPNCGFSSYHREVTFVVGDSSPSKSNAAEDKDVPLKNDMISLKDTFQPLADQQVILNFISYELPTFKDNILSIGTLYHFAVSDVNECLIEELPITDPRLQICWKHNLYRIRFSPKGNTFEMKTAFL